jgi:hypothetical protein
MDITIEYKIACEPEYEPFVGNCSAVDEETDRECEEWIREQLENGNEWAWCCVHVIARIDHGAAELVEGHAYLGCCSYESRESFMECEVDNMKEEAKADLLATLESMIAQGEAAKEALEVLK